jgi:stage II sporulation protein D
VIVRRVLAAGLAVAFTSLTAAAPISADSSAKLVSGLTISGHGFGHGIGLSQWGAEERAKAGQTHQQILSFYYPGTEIGVAPARKVRVLLAEQPRLNIGSRLDFTIVDASGRTVSLAAGHYPVSADGQVDGRTLALPITVDPGKEPVMLGGSRYRGTLTLGLDGGQLYAVNTLDLEQYVGDVVSFENPAYWPPEALRAQAIASRSYALANLRPDSEWDLYPDDRSQNYGGLRKEYPTAVAAASATKGHVLRYRGEIVDALFSASNGGLTSSTDGVWGGPELPYFAIRSDEFDARSPASNWGPIRVGISTLRQDFPDLPSAGIVSISIATNPADRAASVTFLGADGSTVTISGPTFQQRLGLRSTYLSLVPTY